MVLWPAEKDLSVFRDWNDEIFEQFFTRKKYYVFRPDLSDKDEVSGDLIDPVYDEPVVVNMWVKLDPTKDMLDRFGLDERRDLICVVRRREMDKKGIKPKRGDVIVIPDEQGEDVDEYEIRDDHPREYYGNTDSHFHWALTANIRRRSSIEDDRVDDTINPPDDDDVYDDDVVFS